MNYTLSITSKGQVTIPKAIREKLNLTPGSSATFSLNSNDEVVISKPKTLQEIRQILKTPSHLDAPSEREQRIGTQLARKYGVR